MNFILKQFLVMIRLLTKMFRIFKKCAFVSDVVYEHFVFDSVEKYGYWDYRYFLWNWKETEFLAIFTQLKYKD